MAVPCSSTSAHMSGIGHLLSLLLEDHEVADVVPLGPDPPALLPADGHPLLVAGPVVAGGAGPRSDALPDGGVVLGVSDLADAGADRNVDVVGHGGFSSGGGGMILT